MDRYLLVETAQKQIESHMDDKPFETYDENEAFCLGLCTAFNALNAISAADVRENVYADCIKLHDDPYIMWKCGNCGWLRERTSKPKFCEECGAEFLPAVRGEHDARGAD